MPPPLLRPHARETEGKDEWHVAEAAKLGAYRPPVSFTRRRLRRPAAASHTMGSTFSTAAAHNSSIPAMLQLMSGCDVFRAGVCAEKDWRACGRERITSQVSYSGLTEGSS